jgi:hypothetical protein
LCRLTENGGNLWLEVAGEALDEVAGGAAARVDVRTLLQTKINSFGQKTPERISKKIHKVHQNILKNGGIKIELIEFFKIKFIFRC